MEKVVYVLWRPPDVDRDAFADQVRGPLARALLDRGARGLQVNVDDADVADSVMRIQHTRPAMAAVLSVWLDAAFDAAREPLDACLDGVAGRVAAYLVTESEPLHNTAHPAQPGTRTPGVANIAFLRRPADLDASTWLDIWQNQHTAVAIDTQSTFGYVQNVVCRPLTSGAPAWDGIVEELFPPEALTDVAAMFDAAGDPVKFARNLSAMRTSTAGFGADTDLDVLPTSRYVIASPFSR